MPRLRQRTTSPPISSTVKRRTSSWTSWPENPWERRSPYSKNRFYNRKKIHNEDEVIGQPIEEQCTGIHGKAPGPKPEKPVGGQPKGPGCVRPGRSGPRSEESRVGN